jgi:DNA repair protein RecN (Recombination protein N)
MEDLKKQIQHAESSLQDQGQKLSDKRKVSFKPFATRVEKVLKSLNMKSAHFQLHHQALANATPNGYDGVNMLFAANAGQDPQPLKKVASGGELSRLMLAVKMLSSDKSFRNTIVFDEIDSGVSGEVAHSMGDIIKQMADGTQVICITHLPQIASKGSAHFKVFKTEKGKTETRIERLDENARITEIAQMLSGANTTDAALANAQELLGAK